MLARVSSSARGGRNSAAMTELSARSRSTIDKPTVYKPARSTPNPPRWKLGVDEIAVAKSPDASLPDIPRCGAYRHRLEVSARHRHGAHPDRRRPVPGAQGAA